MTAVPVSVEILGIEEAPYPPPVPVVRAILGDIAAVGTMPPKGDPNSPWNGDPPFLRIRVIGGTDDGTTDRPRIDVDTLTDDEKSSDMMAERVRQRLGAAPFRVTIGDTTAVVDAVSMESRPHQVPWGANAQVFNCTATYTVSMRRQRPALP